MKKNAEGGAEAGNEQPSMVARGADKHRSRRRLLRWALGLVPIVVGVSWAAPRWLRPSTGRGEEDSGEPDGPVDGWRAEAGLERGGPPEDAPDARTQAEEWTRDGAAQCFARHPETTGRLHFALRADDSYAPAHLVFACWFIEHDRWDLAREHLSHPSLKDTPESRLLLELMERRPKSPDWRHAFFEAWNKLGRPDFSHSPLLPAAMDDDHLLPFLAVGSIEQLDEPRRLPLVTLFTQEEEAHPEWGLPQVSACDSIPMLMALRERLLPPVEERLAQLTGSAPPTLQLALRTFLAARPPEALFQHRDLEALEPLVTLGWKQTPSEHFFREMRERFDGLLLLPGHHAFLLATWAQGVSLGQELQRRARASAPHLNENERRWMGRLLWEVGARLREQRSRVELERGLLLQMYGSELTGHGPTRMESIGLWVELGRWEEALKHSGFKRWPLASLHEECCEPRARDEHTWLQAFSGKAALP